MRRFLICSFLSISCLLAYGQQLGFRIIGDKKKVSFPFELHNNLIVVPVVLNNQIPLKFIVDTGVRTTILTEKAFSDILGLKYVKKYEIAGIGQQQTVEAFVTNNVALTLPGVSGRGHAMLVLNEDYLELRNYLGVDVHGILGYELFSRFIVHVDYDKRMLTLTTPEYFKHRRSFDKIPITVEDTKPYVKAFVSYGRDQYVPVKLLIDTGASHGILLEKESSEKIYVPEKNIISELGRGIGGRLEGQIARLNYFHIGKHCWPDPIATFPKSNAVLDSLKYGNVERNGAIGGEILSRFEVIFDFPREHIYLKRSRSFKEEFNYNLSGLSVKAKGSRLNTFEIVEIRENSPGAEAGFKEGDIILAINGLSVKNMTLNHITNYLNLKENKKIKIEVQRGDEQIKKKFRLISQI